MCLDSWPIELAANSEATNAKITASGAPPPLKAMPAGIDSAVAIAGAMNVMDWKSTDRRTAPDRTVDESAMNDMVVMKSIWSIYTLIFTVGGALAGTIFEVTMKAKPNKKIGEK